MRRVLRVHHGRHFEKLDAQRIDLHIGQRRALERECAQPLDQHIAQRGKQHAQLVALEILAARARCEQLDPGLFDSVLGLAALAQIVAQRLGLARQIGHHVARVVALRAILQTTPKSSDFWLVWFLPRRLLEARSFPHCSLRSPGVIAAQEERGDRRLAVRCTHTRPKARSAKATDGMRSPGPNRVRWLTARRRCEPLPRPGFSIDPTQSQAEACR